MEPKLRLTDLQQELQWRSCQESPEFFFENFYYIAVVGQGPRLFKLRDYQREILNELRSNDHVLSLKARQIGMTTIVVGYAIWHALFNNDSPWLFVSRNELAAKKMLQRAKYALARLPKWMKERIGDAVSETQTYVEFANGSYIESVPATGGTGRGDSVFGAVLDEVAFMEYAEEIWAAIEPLVYGKNVLISTANGMGNFFHDIWLDSEKDDSIWLGLFHPWNVVPSRDEGWYRTRQLAHRGREWFFYQEYPSTPSEAFAKSGRVAFPHPLFDYLDWKEPEFLYSWDGEQFNLTEGEEDLILRVWALPEVELTEAETVARPPNYVIGVDVAEGLDHGDYTVVKVFDANNWEEVAAHKSHIPVEDIGPLVEYLGYWYHTALLIVERNNHGLVPLTYLHQAGYPRLYRHKTTAARAQDRRREYGFSTNRKTKPKLVKDMLRALRDHDVVLRDKDFVFEAHVFVADGRGSYAATANKHDDVIMATIITWQGVLDVDRFPIIWVDTRERPTTFADMLSVAYPPEPKMKGLDVPLGDPERRTQFKPTVVVAKQTK